MPAPPRQPDKPPRRRTPAGASRTSGASGPGRPGASSRSTRPSRAVAASSAWSASSGGRARPVASGRAAAAKPRLTGRAAILVLVLAVLAVSYASSLRAYLQQRTQIDSLQSTITERQAEIDQFEQELARWQDPEYVETEARERLGYVMPGETPFVVLRDGQPLQPESELTDPATIATSPPTAFWDDAWETMIIAGNPQRRADPPPLTRIQDPDGSPE